MSLKESEISAAYCKYGIDWDQALCEPDGLNFATGHYRVTPRREVGGVRAGQKKVQAPFDSFLILHDLIERPRMLVVNGRRYGLMRIHCKSSAIRR
jgi:hypothetical protein